MIMKNTSKQKLRLLYIIDILASKSDEEHLLSANDIINYLKDDYGIECERKTVYDCIECLNEYGYEIIKSQSPRGYFMVPYHFETAELRLLIDAVQSANFISAKKTCIAKYSLKSGSYVENQELCESNWAKDSTCYDIEPSKIFCTSNEDCKGIKIAGDITTEEIFKCVRTWAGQNVCEYNSQTII